MFHERISMSGSYCFCVAIYMREAQMHGNESHSAIEDPR